MVNNQFHAICLDSSIVAKLAVKESDSPKAIFLYHQIIQQGTDIFSPDFLKVEIYSIIRKKSRFKRISSKQAQTALANFNQLSIKYFDFNFLLVPAYRLAQKLNLPVVYDCLFLALAMEQKIPLVTADLQFLKKAKVVHKNSYSLLNFPQKSP